MRRRFRFWFHVQARKKCFERFFVALVARYSLKGLVDCDESVQFCYYGPVAFCA